MKDNGGFFVLSHPLRREILELVKERERRHSNLKKELDMSPAETTRHLQKLLESGLIKKAEDGGFAITQYGRLIQRELHNLDFLDEHRAFFDTHDVSSIPPELFSFKQMSMSELIEGAMPVMGKLYDITDRAQAFLWSMTPGPVESFIRRNVEKLESDIELKMLYREDAGIPSDYMGGRCFPLEIRRMDPVDMGIWLNEKEGLIMLPGAGGDIDYSAALYGKEPSFLRWCSLLFENYWLPGRDVNL